MAAEPQAALLDAPDPGATGDSPQGVRQTAYAPEQSSYKDGLYTEQWMAAQCGIADLQNILPAHWRVTPCGGYAHYLSCWERVVEALNSS